MYSDINTDFPTFLTESFISQSEIIIEFSKI